MRLTVIGCSGSVPGPDSAASCYLVEAAGFRLLLDLGYGSYGALQRYLDPDSIDAVCLSHLHLDHCVDLCAYWVARKYSARGPRPPLPVYGPEGTADRMARVYGVPTEPGMKEEFDFVTLTPGRREIGPLRITLARMNHPVQTYGFRIEHGGASLAYSADTGPSDALIELARGADVLLCEASFPEAPDLPRDRHLTGGQAGEHAVRARAHRLVLTHLSPWCDAGPIHAAAREAFPGPVTLAASGARYEVRD